MSQALKIEGLKIEEEGLQKIHDYVESERCSHCGISVKFPGIKLDDDGVCHLCKDEGTRQEIEELRKNLNRQLDEVITKIGKRGDYDCIVAYSGGKDSSMTLLKLTRDYGLNCLAITIDNGFLSDSAIKNCHAFTQELGVDFTMFTPSFGFMRNMYRKSIENKVHSNASAKRASAVCNSCIGLINNHMIKTAISMEVDMIAGGYLGGQVPKDAAVMEMNANNLVRFRESALDHYKMHFGDEAQKFFGIPPHVLEKLGDRTLYVTNPMLGWEYDKEAIIKEISQYGWEKPSDTGQHSSNCRLNDVGIIFHLKESGFHPYETELTDLVRKGFMTREDAIGKLNDIPDLDQYSDVMQKL
ncbi:MAG: hypothetical protein MRY79_00030 [Alphaproteobacteria bacterium]|nr:hypothetical protein [Alphaproteobacteria bacterium]